ncbi:hypothetical protein GCM10007108_13700 [Thermogymnomonas acidicola]|uniref:Metallo-beta-lactamase domain-containing protein n=1 Tax=Thermogymnomonas acidicola TaxID=399579 RepID=A0AA37BS22_9ARCH|nr:MBL fold metallo-hydrolase [Thermogymnomonas acidicola]GGM76866.1 hypothetical protein GCM10007108_13700 [Thermogymnomonas acidicola]
MKTPGIAHREIDSNVGLLMGSLGDVDLNILVISPDGDGKSMLDCGTADMAQQIHDVAGVPKRVYVSHSHYDHDGGAGFFSSLGSEIFASQATIALLQTPETALESFFPWRHRVFLEKQQAERFAEEILRQSSTGAYFKPVKRDDGEPIEVIDAPGHVAGMQVFRYRDILFTSDAIQGSGIKGSAYTDSIPQISSFQEYFQTLRKVMSLKNEVMVPGHNYSPASSRVIEGSAIDRFLAASYDTARRILDYAYDALSEDWQSIGTLAAYLLRKFSIGKLYPQCLITAEAAVSHYCGIVLRRSEGGISLYRIP